MLMGSSPLPTTIPSHLLSRQQTTALYIDEQVTDCLASTITLASFLTNSLHIYQTQVFPITRELRVLILVVKRSKVLLPTDQDILESK